MGFWDELVQMYSSALGTDTEGLGTKPPEEILPKFAGTSDDQTSFWDDILNTTPQYGVQQQLRAAAANSIPSEKWLDIPNRVMVGVGNVIESAPAILFNALNDNSFMGVPLDKMQSPLNPEDEARINRENELTRQTNKAEYLDSPLAQMFQNAGQGLQKTFATPVTPNDYSPSGLAGSIAEAIPFTALAFALGKGLGKIGVGISAESMAANRARIMGQEAGTIMPNMTEKILSSVATQYPMTAFEAHTEQVNFEKERVLELMAQGMSSFDAQRQAHQEGNNVQTRNKALLGFTNTFGAMPGNALGKLMNSKVGQIATAAVSEGTEEAGQGIIGYKAAGKDVDWSDIAYQGTVGAIMGAGMHSVEMVTHPGEKIDQTTSTILQKVDQDIAEKDYYTNLLNTLQAQAPQLQPMYSKRMSADESAPADFTNNDRSTAAAIQGLQETYAPGQSYAQGFAPIAEAKNMDLNTTGLGTPVSPLALASTVMIDEQDAFDNFLDRSHLYNQKSETGKGVYELGRTENFINPKAVLATQPKQAIEFLVKNFANTQNNPTAFSGTIQALVHGDTQTLQARFPNADPAEVISAIGVLQKNIPSDKTLETNNPIVATALQALGYDVLQDTNLGRASDNFKQFYASLPTAPGNKNTKVLPESIEALTPEQLKIIRQEVIDKYNPKTNTGELVLGTDERTKTHKIVNAIGLTDQLKKDKELGAGLKTTKKQLEYQMGQKGKEIQWLEDKLNKDPRATDSALLTGDERGDIPTEIMQNVQAEMQEKYSEDRLITSQDLRAARAELEAMQKEHAKLGQQEQEQEAAKDKNYAKAFSIAYKEKAKHKPGTTEYKAAEDQIKAIGEAKKAPTATATATATTTKNNLDNSREVYLAAKDKGDRSEALRILASQYYAAKGDPVKQKQIQSLIQSAKANLKDTAPTIKKHTFPTVVKSTTQTTQPTQTTPLAKQEPTREDYFKKGFYLAYQEKNKAKYKKDKIAEQIADMRIKEIGEEAKAEGINLHNGRTVQTKNEFEKLDNSREAYLAAVDRKDGEEALRILASQYYSAKGNPVKQKQIQKLIQKTKTDLKFTPTPLAISTSTSTSTTNTVNQTKAPLVNTITPEQTASADRIRQRHAIVMELLAGEKEEVALERAELGDRATPLELRRLRNRELQLDLQMHDAEDDVARLGTTIQRTQQTVKKEEPTPVKKEEPTKQDEGGNKDLREQYKKALDDENYVKALSMLERAITQETDPKKSKVLEGNRRKIVASQMLKDSPTMIQAQYIGKPSNLLTDLKNYFVSLYSPSSITANDREAQLKAHRFKLGSPSQESTANQFGNAFRHTLRKLRSGVFKQLLTEAEKTKDEQKVFEAVQQELDTTAKELYTHARMSDKKAKETKGLEYARESVSGVLQNKQRLEIQYPSLAKLGILKSLQKAEAATKPETRVPLDELARWVSGLLPSGGRATGMIEIIQSDTASAKKFKDITQENYVGKPENFKKDLLGLLESYSNIEEATIINKDREINTYNFKGLDEQKFLKNFLSAETKNEIEKYIGLIATPEEFKRKAYVRAVKLIVSLQKMAGKDSRIEKVRLDQQKNILNGITKIAVKQNLPEADAFKAKMAEYIHTATVNYEKGKKFKKVDKAAGTILDSEVKEENKQELNTFIANIQDTFGIEGLSTVADTDIGITDVGSAEEFVYTDDDFPGDIDDYIRKSKNLSRNVLEAPIPGTNEKMFVLQTALTSMSSSNPLITLAKELDLKVFAMTPMDERANIDGWFDPKTKAMYLNMSDPKVAIKTFYHEMGHFLKTQRPETFKEVTNLIKASLVGASGKPIKDARKIMRAYQQEIEMAERLGQTAADVISEEKLMSLFANIMTEPQEFLKTIDTPKTFIQTVMKAMHDFFDWIKKNSKIASTEANKLEKQTYKAFADAVKDVKLTKAIKKRNDALGLGDVEAAQQAFQEQEYIKRAAANNVLPFYEKFLEKVANIQQNRQKVISSLVRNGTADSQTVLEHVIEATAAEIRMSRGQPVDPAELKYSQPPNVNNDSRISIRAAFEQVFGTTIVQGAVTNPAIKNQTNPMRNVVRNIIKTNKFHDMAQVSSLVGGKFYMDNKQLIDRIYASKAKSLTLGRARFLNNFTDYMMNDLVSDPIEASKFADVLKLIDAQMYTEMANIRDAIELHNNMNAEARLEEAIRTKNNPKGKWTLRNIYRTWKNSITDKLFLAKENLKDMDLRDLADELALLNTRAASWTELMITCTGDLPRVLSNVFRGIEVPVGLKSMTQIFSENKIAQDKNGFEKFGKAVTAFNQIEIFKERMLDVLEDHKHAIDMLDTEGLDAYLKQVSNLETEEALTQRQRSEAFDILIGRGQLASIQAFLKKGAKFDEAKLTALAYIELPLARRTTANIERLKTQIQDEFGSDYTLQDILNIPLAKYEQYLMERTEYKLPYQQMLQLQKYMEKLDYEYFGKISERQYKESKENKILPFTEIFELDDVKNKIEAKTKNKEEFHSGTVGDPIGAFIANMARSMSKGAKHYMRAQLMNSIMLGNVESAELHRVDKENAKHVGDNLSVSWRGEHYSFKVPDSLYQLFHELNTEQIQLTVPAYKKFLDFNRATTIFDPAFIVKMAYKDFKASLMNAFIAPGTTWAQPHKYLNMATPIIGIVKGISAFVGKTDLWWDFIGSGSKINYVSDRQETIEDFKAEMQEVARTYGKGSWQWIKANLVIGTQIAEQGIRVGNYKVAYDGFKKAGYTPEQASNKAALYSRSAYDPTKMGKHTELLAKNLNFFNAQLQGSMQFFDNYVADLCSKDPDTVNRALIRWVRSLIYLTVPTIISSLIGGADDKDRDPSIRAIANFYKMDKIPLLNKLGLSGYLSMPKAFELGAVFETLPEELMQKYFHKNQQVTGKSVTWSTIQGFIPLAQNVLGVNTLAAAMNFDLARLQIIDSPYTENLPPSERYYASTNKLYKELGQVLNMSPARISAVVRTLAGGATLNPLEAIGNMWASAKGETPAKSLAMTLSTGIAPLWTQDIKSSAVPRIFLDQLQHAEQIQTLLKKYEKNGQTKEAQTLVKANIKDIILAKQAQPFVKDIIKLSAEAKRVKTLQMPEENKQKILATIDKRKKIIAESYYKTQKQKEATQ